MYVRQRRTADIGVTQHGIDPGLQHILDIFNGVRLLEGRSRRQTSRRIMTSTGIPNQRDETDIANEARRLESLRQLVVRFMARTRIPNQMDETNIVDEARRLVELRRRQPVTPYNADEWEVLLQHFQLSDKYPNLVQSIRQGFDVGIGRKARTETPSNSPTLAKYPEAYSEIIGREFETGRYIGPYSKSVVEAVLGPFRTSPLSLIPKPSKPGKFRAVHNFSYSYASSKSINHDIDSDQYPCTYGTFDIVLHLVYHLPPGSEASIRDISEAYRTIPVIPSQWPGLVVRLSGDDSYAINTNNDFGIASAGGVFGQLADASADIFRASGIGPVCKWVDDYIWFRVPREHIASYNDQRREWRSAIDRNGGKAQKTNGRIWFQGDKMSNDQVAEFDENMAFPIQDCSGHSPRSSHDSLFSYSDADIDQLSQRLGIPWEASKTTPFRSIVKYNGFIWDLSSRTVSLPEDKRLQYAQEICEFRDKSLCTLEEVQMLIGKLNWASTVVQAGRAYLTSLAALISAFSSCPFTACQPPPEVADDLEWWLNTLRLGVERSILDPYNILDMEAYFDATSKVGIGITIGRHWRAWRLVPGWMGEQRDIEWAEAVAFEFLARALCMMINPGTYVRVYGDNEGVVNGWHEGKRKNKPTNIVFRRIHDIQTSHRCSFVTRYVPSARNPADGPSRGVYPSIEYLLPRIPIPPELNCFIVDSH